jgi:hypothetical protein
VSDGTAAGRLDPHRARQLAEHAEIRRLAGAVGA